MGEKERNSGYWYLPNQERAMRILKNSVEKGRISHGYLFTGPSGSGRKDAAFKFAKALLCENYLGDEGRPCGMCTSCRKSDSRIHPDLSFIVPDEKGTIKIEAVKDLRSRSALKSGSGGWRVTVIEDAHLMTVAAANSFLKTLEEPGEKTVFILTVDEDRKKGMLSTVLSRCQTVLFNPLPLSLAEDILARLNPALPREEIRAVTIVCGGSLEAAGEFINEGMPEKRKEWIRFCSDIERKNVSEIIGKSADFDKNPVLAERILRILACFYRDILIWREGLPETMFINPDMRKEMEDIYLSMEEIKDIIKNINAKRDILSRHTSPRLVMEVFFLELKLGI